MVNGLSIAEMLKGLENNKFFQQLEVRRRSSDNVPPDPWINRDIVPLPPSRRTWGSWSFVGFWLLTAVNISGWTQGSALLGLGLNVWQAMISVIIAEIIVGFAVVLNGLPGGEWHIGFPIINRYVWGLWGSFFPLLMRILLSFVWYGTQLWFGGESIKVVIGSIWPSFLTMKNTLPLGEGLETNDLIAVIVFWVISLPLLAVPPEYYKTPFRYGSISITITAFTLFIYCLARSSSTSGSPTGGPLISHPGQFSGLGSGQTVKGSKLGWAMVQGITSTIGGICAGILNQSDYSRFARKPGDQILSQILVVPICTVITSLIGIVCTSCAAGFFPNEPLLWQPYNLLIAIQQHGGPGARAATFFAGWAFVISQWGINISGNAISGGIDLSGLFPRYINIRRGAYITAIVGLAINPWRLVNTPNTFINVLSGFSVFLGPATGLMITDFVLVRRHKLRLTHLYEPSSQSIYWYTQGFNFRAIVAWIMGVWPLMPGFVASVQGSTTSIGWTHLYALAWPLGFTISGAIFYLLNRLFPPKGLGETDDHDYYGTFGPAEGYESEDQSTTPNSGEKHSVEKESPTDLEKF